MNWTTVKGMHLNLDQVQEFHWKDGELRIALTGSDAFYCLNDPDRRWYEHTCNRVSLLPVEKEDKAHD